MRLQFRIIGLACKSSRARNPKSKTPGAGRRVQCGAQPDEASNTLTRRPATYNRLLDLRTRQPADALIRVDVKILEHRLNANISRSSCPYLRAIYRRHHPLTKSLWKKRGKTGATKSDKRRQRTCRNMTPFATSSHTHGGSDEGNEAILCQTSSLSTA